MWVTHSTAMPEDRWQLLGPLLIQRRTALDPRYHNRTTFAEVTGLNYRVVYDIEEARRTNFGGSILAAIEAAYRLEPGSIARFLTGAPLDVQPSAGGRDSTVTPVPEPPAPVHSDVPALNRLPVKQRFIDEVRADLEARKPPQGAWEETIWNDTRVPFDDKVFLAAYHRQLEAEGQQRESSG